MSDTPRTEALARKWAASLHSDGTLTQEGREVYSFARILERELAQMKSDRDAKTARMWELGRECDRLERELAEERATHATMEIAHEAQDAASKRAIEALERQNAALREAVDAMVEDGWLDCGVEGLSEAQKKLYRAWLVLHPDRDAIEPPSQGGGNG